MIVVRRDAAMVEIVLDALGSRAAAVCAIPDECDQTPLFMALRNAAKYGFLNTTAVHSILRVLGNRAAKVCASANKQGQTPLHVVAEYPESKLDVVHAILTALGERAASVCTMPDTLDLTPMEIAMSANRESPKVIQLILQPIAQQKTLTLSTAFFTCPFFNPLITMLKESHSIHTLTLFPKPSDKTLLAQNEQYLLLIYGTVLEKLNTILEQNTTLSKVYFAGELDIMPIYQLETFQTMQRLLHANDQGIMRYQSSKRPCLRASYKNDGTQVITTTSHTSSTFGKATITQLSSTKTTTTQLPEKDVSDLNETHCIESDNLTEKTNILE